MTHFGDATGISTVFWTLRGDTCGTPQPAALAAFISRPQAVHSTRRDPLG
jgi:hypothetical protein